MSSAYSSASQIANLREKAGAKSMDPAYRQKLLNDSHNNSSLNNLSTQNGCMNFNPKQEYFGNQGTLRDFSKINTKKHLSVSQSMSPNTL